MRPLPISLLRRAEEVRLFMRAGGLFRKKDERQMAMVAAMVALVGRGPMHGSRFFSEGVEALSSMGMDRAMMELMELEREWMSDELSKEDRNWVFTLFDLFYALCEYRAREAPGWRVEDALVLGASRAAAESGALETPQDWLVALAQPFLNYGSRVLVGHEDLGASLVYAPDEARLNVYERWKKLSPVQAYARTTGRRYEGNIFSPLLYGDGWRGVRSVLWFMATDQGWPEDGRPSIVSLRRLSAPVAAVEVTAEKVAARKGGTAVVVVPARYLFDGTDEEMSSRASILKRRLVRAVVSVPDPRGPMDRGGEEHFVMVILAKGDGRVAVASLRDLLMETEWIVGRNLPGEEEETVWHDPSQWAMYAGQALYEVVMEGRRMGSVEWVDGRELARAGVLVPHPVRARMGRGPLGFKQAGEWERLVHSRLRTDQALEVKDGTQRKNQEDM